jgi:hypothetical protein
MEQAQGRAEAWLRSRPGDPRAEGLLQEVQGVR